MENKDVKDLVEILMKSLDDTQLNAIDIEKLVEQICNLSSQEVYDQLIAEIIADKNIDWDKKIDLIQKANAEYDQRVENNTRRVKDLQSTQTQNVEATTSWWGENWIYFVGGCCLALIVLTPGGRKALSAGKTLLLNA